MSAACLCTGGPPATRRGVCVDCGENAGLPPELADTGRCSACRAPIVWATTVNGKAMPVDLEPAENGNVRLEAIPGSTGAIARVLAGATLEASRAAGEELRTSHHYTCPHGPAFRRRRAVDTAATPR